MNTQFDVTEVIFSHIDLVFTKLDQIRSVLFHGSTLDSAFSSKAGGDVIDFIREAEKSKMPKIGNSVKKFISEQSSRIINVTEATCYCLHWCDNAVKTLKMLCNNSLELDIRWNYSFTIRFCQIFVALCKVLLFFSYFTNARNCVTLALYVDGGENNPNLKTPGKLSDFTKKAAFCTDHPFEVLQSDPKSQANSQNHIISLQLGQLISQIGPFLIQVIGEWPLLDWQDFVVFNRAPKQQSDSTLPNMEHIVLANLQTLVDTSYFFSFCFPQFISSHPQFLALMNELVSETELILVSKATSIPISHLIVTYNRFLNAAKSKIPGIKLEPIDEKVVSSKMHIKYTMSHKQRITHLVVILRDIMNLCECEAAYLPTLTYDVISLSGYAYYELSIMLLKNDNSFKPQNSEEKSEDDSSVVLQIIDILVRIAKIYCKYERHIMRFFVYNLATVDLVYFSRIYRQYCGDSFDWQNRLTSYIGDLCYQIQENVDLDEFDNGVRYDFIPFIYTHGRILHYYNYLKIHNHIAYLQTIFEHLETIRTNMLFAQSPVQAFLTFCPIHTLWRSYLKFADFLKNAPGGIHLISSIINLFSFFNHDTISMSVLTLDVDNITKMFTKSRADILNYMYLLLNKHLDEESLMMNVIRQNRFDRLFNPSHFVRSQEEINVNDVEADTEVANTIWQMKELLLRLPDSINFNDTDYPVCSYIAQGITNNLGNLIFKKIVPDAFLLDSKFSIATQIVWPLYTMLNASFSMKLYQSKYEHGNCFKAASLSDIVYKLKVDDMSYPPFSSKSKSQPAKSSDIDPSVLASMVQAPKIVNTFIDSLKSFLTHEYFDCLYLPYRKKFISVGKGQYFSLAAFESLFLSLGLVSGFHIDHLLIQHAAHTMADIFYIYIKNQAEISKLLTDFKRGGISWMNESENESYQKAGQLMIKLGVILKIRELTREAMKKTMDKTLIGFSDIVAASAKKSTSEHLNSSKDLLIEMTTTIPNFSFIESYLENAKIEQSSDPMQFFFFLALLLSHSQWKKVEFKSANETISHNLHLYPVAVDAFLNLFKVFCVSSDSQIIGDGMTFFFSVIFQFINKMRSSASVDIKTSFTFIVLVDLFPKITRDIEYGRVSQSFPNSMISTAYRHLEKQDEQTEPVAQPSNTKSPKKKK